jgi:hypothetical protein
MLASKLVQLLDCEFEGKVVNLRVKGGEQSFGDPDEDCSELFAVNRD